MDENIFEISDEEEVETPSTQETEDNQESSETDVEQTSNTEAEQSEVPEDEDKKVLDYINKKGLIKFNGEAVQIKDLNDLVANYQKGLNYDKVANRENTVMDYIKEKASSLKITPEEYINRVKDYEEQKKKESQEAEVDKLINRGLDEDTAREIVQTRLAREQFEKEKAEYQRRIAEDEKRKKEDEEYIDFIKNHPELKVDEIPQEVFEASKEIGLSAAYNQYENKILKEKIKQYEQDKNNASSSVVHNTTDSGSTNQRGEDAFVNALFYK